MKRRFRASLWLALGLALVGTAAAQESAVGAEAACAPQQLKNSVEVDHYLFNSYRGGDGACLRVVRDGKVILRRTVGNGGYYTLGQSESKEANAPGIKDGADITGRGHPDMIVSVYTGAAHCCLSHYVFELEPDFKLLATLGAEDGDYAHFSDIDGDGHYFYMANDWAFAYWREDFAESPAPEVILGFVEDGKGGGYHLALDKMQQPEPGPADWERATQEARQAFAANNQFGDGIGSKLWGNLLKLIYTRHSDLAWKLFDEAWPSTRPGKDKFLGDFCSQLKTSPYWPDLEKTVKNAPAACVDAKPKDTSM